MYWWFYRTTGLGKSLLLALVLSGSLGAGSIEMPIFRLFCALAAVIGLALLISLVWRPRVEVSVQFPERAVAGQPLSVEARITNAGRFPVHNLAAGFFHDIPELPGAEHPSVESVRPGETARVLATLRPQRRGLYGPLKLRTFSTYPLHLFRTPCGRPAGGTLLVMPSFHPISSVELPISTRYQPGGIALTSNVGESPEYIGNREYRPGDSLRRMDFKAWGRLGRPAVREYQEEYYCRIALILDTYVPRFRRPGRSGFPDLEAAVSLCAAAADALARGEYIIDLFAAGPELHVFRAGRHTAHFDHVLEILACVDACRTNPFDKVTPALLDELGSISALVAVLLDWDNSREEMVRVAQDHGCATKVLLVRAGPPTKPYESSEFPISHFDPAMVRLGGIEIL